MRNCLYCNHFNKVAVSCDSPKAHLIATFNPNQEKDCILFKYDRTENPEVPEKLFAEKFCIGKKCPYYFASKRICTRPSLCPYKDEEPDIFNSIQLKEDKS